MGHMNVQFYMEKYDQASWNVFSELGLTGKFLRENNRGMAGLEQRIRYYKELLAGDTITIETELLELTEKKIRVRHTMIRQEPPGLVSELELLGIFIDTVKRKSSKFPLIVFEKKKELFG